MKHAIHLLRLSDSRDRTIATVPGLVTAQLDASGLFYGYNIPGKGPAGGRVAFVPFPGLTRLLGS